MCYICGNPTCTNPDYCESAQPFCDQCANDSVCVDKMDSACVIYHFDDSTPSKLTNLGFPNKTSVETILEKIDQLIGAQFNIQFTPQDSITIKWTPGGTAGHSPKADLIISPQSGNTVQALDDGLFAPAYNKDYKVKVDSTDAPDYLKNQIVGGTDGIVSISTTVQSGLLQLLPSINLLCLINALRANFQAEFCDLVDSCKCLLLIQNLVATIAPACPSGYTLVNGVCQETISVPATSGSTTYNLQAETNVVWSKGGTIIFKNGFNINGSGPGANYSTDASTGDIDYIYTANVWLNGDSTPFDGTNTIDKGPMNRTAVWSNPYNADTTFIVPITVPVSKTYYIGLGVDNVGSIDITSPNGVITNVLTQDTAAAGSYYLGSGTWNFDFWNIYPVALTAGLNYITVSGHDTGSAFGFGIEIYDNTPTELAAAAFDPTYAADPGTFPYGTNYYSNLNLIFTSRCARQPGAITANSASCPDSSYTLDTTTGSTPTAPCQGINNPVSNWTCTKVIQTAFTGYVGTVVWDRIPNAISYTVQQKLHTDPDTAYIESAGSPVADPGSGSTVSLTIGSLPSNDMDFRVRANFDNCTTAWSTVESTSL